MIDLPIDMPNDRYLSIGELRGLVEAVAKRSELWEDGLNTDSPERPCVNLHDTEHLGLWAIGWSGEQHDTGFHDHDRSNGAVHVVRGAIRHEHLRLDGPPVATVVPGGETFSFDDTFIHRMRFEPGFGQTVTIHAYSPPLTRTGQYGTGHDGVLRRLSTESDDPLKPKPHPEDGP